MNDTDGRPADIHRCWLLQKRTYANGAYLTHLDDSDANLGTYAYDAFSRTKNHRWKSSGGTLLAGCSLDLFRRRRALRAYASAKRLNLARPSSMSATGIPE